MTNTSSLANLVTEAFEDANYYYVTNDPERALGLEHLFENYYILCVDDSDIVDYIENSGIEVFSYERRSSELNSLFRNSAKLLSQDLTRKYIEQSKDKKYFQTFKISPRFEKLVENYGGRLLNTSANLNRKFENKLSQYKALSDNGINFPKTILIQLGKANYGELVDQLGGELVVQFNRGHTGSGTLFVNNSDSFSKLQSEYPERIVKVSERVDGIAYTLNAVVANNATYMGGLSYQITGIKELTNMLGGTVGNDFFVRTDVDETILTKIISQIESIGDVMREDGYRGLFGVDLIVGENMVYIIEVNARQPASIPFYTKLQIQNDQVPLSLLHLAEFLDVPYEINAKDYNRECLLPIEASQIFLRNTNESHFKVQGSVKTGVYRLQSDDSALDYSQEEPSVKENTIFLDEEKDKPLVWQHEAYNILQIKDGGMLILTPMLNKIVSAGGELARIQVLQSVMNADLSLKPWVTESLLAVKRYLI